MTIFTTISNYYDSDSSEVATSKTNSTSLSFSLSDIQSTSSTFNSVASPMNHAGSCNYFINSEGIFKITYD